MKRGALIILLATLAVTAQQLVPKAPMRFEAVDIFVDSGRKPLAAYQLEFSGPTNTIRIVGIEGGEPDAFKNPPFYDPDAMQQERVIIAAFNTAPREMLPAGNVRIATIHLQISGGDTPAYNLKLHTAADSEGNSISVKTTFTERKSL